MLKQDGEMISVATMHLCHGVTMVSNIQTNERGCVPIKLYQPKQERGQICSLGSVLLSSEQSLFERLFAGY